MEDQKFGEISFDTIEYEDDTDHLEGCYRIMDAVEWNIFYFTHWHSGNLWTGQLVLRNDVVWPSGVSGVEAIVPVNTKLNTVSAREILSRALGVTVNWVDAPGPDSLGLK